MKYFNFPLESPKTTYNNPNVFYGFDGSNKGDYLINVPSDYRISESTAGFYQVIGKNTSTDPNDETSFIIDKSLYFEVKKVYRSIPLSWKMLNGHMRDTNDQPTNFE